VDIFNSDLSGLTAGKFDVLGYFLAPWCLFIQDQFGIHKQLHSIVAIGMEDIPLPLPALAPHPWP
jgi:hypothetical protein